MKLNTYHKKKEVYDENLEKLYVLIWGQLTSGLKAEIKGISEFEEKTTSQMSYGY